MSNASLPLSRAEVRQVIEGRGAASRVPIAIHPWIQPEKFGTQEAACRAVLAQYPCDIVTIQFNIPKVFQAPADDPSYRWLNFDDPFPPGTPLDAISALDDWAKLDAVLADFPSPDYPGLIPPDAPPDDGRYRVGLWWYWLFERMWSVRGMENSLVDFYDAPDEIHRLFRALTDFYKRMLTRGRRELGLDAVWTSDDIGAQTSTFFSPDIFETFFLPYYAELIAHAHSLGMHFWMHCCGNIKAFLPRLADIGLDVIHPIQKYTMDEKEIALLVGDRLAIWAGMDVQQTMPFSTAADVRQEVRFMLDAYYRPDGRLLLAAGNNLTPDIPLENIEALLDEGLHYGAAIGK